MAAIQSLEDFNAINVLIGAACVFVKPQTHLCSRPTAAFLRRVYSPPRSLQPTTVISPRPRQPASKLRGSAASTFAKEHAACKMEREKKKRHSVLRNSSQASQSHLQTQPNAKKITLSNQPSICQKYHYRVISNGSAALVYLFPK